MNEKTESLTKGYNERIKLGRGTYLGKKFVRMQLGFDGDVNGGVVPLLRSLLLVQNGWIFLVCLLLVRVLD